MELPHIGLRCNNSECNQLDFLPIKCDACKNIFCAEHYKYASHDCSEAGKRNKSVPVCEKCQSVVPAKNLSEDEAMRLHLSNLCTPYKKNKIYTNRCNKAECKRKELIPFCCDDCRLSFCVKHRHASDHNCRGATSARESCAATAEKRLGRLTLKAADPTESTKDHRQSSESCGAQQRAANSGRQTLRNSSESVRATNANLSEEEALALAIAQSEADAKKREEENGRRLVDAAAS